LSQGCIIRLTADWGKTRKQVIILPLMVLTHLYIFTRVFVALQLYIS